MRACWLALAFAAAPAVQPGADLDPALTAEVAATWTRLGALSAAAGAEEGPAHTLAIGLVDDLPTPQNGKSVPGQIALRRGLPPSAQLTALRHELAHQFLWATCPTSAEDQLFHEAFATATSGELADFSGAAYLSAPQALARLEHALELGALDRPAAREALARLLSEAADPLRPVLRARLQRCADGVHWLPLTPRELAADGLPAAADGLVVLGRHSGALLFSRGDLSTPRPFGSTLKPFLIAGAQAPLPALPINRGRPEWSCGDDLPAELGADLALLRSCNGWFLDWGARDSSAARLGKFGPALVALGLARLPTDMAEAIGLRPTLTLSPLALARAYRLLAASQPGLLEVLAQNAERGTLAGLPISTALAGLALKTGTVRDPLSRATLGWIAAVDRDLVVVMVRAGRAPREFAAEFADALAQARRRPGLAETEVQTFGLVGPEAVAVRCPSLGFTVGAGDPSPLTPEAVSLGRALDQGALVCLSGPFLVSVSGSPARPYEGTFRRSPLEGRLKDTGPERARAGSEVIFTTSRDRYAAGVVAAEDASANAPTRAALLAVVAHNASHSRHGKRPICDTTHCQVFRGTRAPSPADLEALAEPLSSDRFLPFAHGGRAPWVERRPMAALAAVLGAPPLGLTFGDGRVRFRRTVSEGESVYEEQVDASCEWFRGRLKLPSCPTEAEVVRGAVRFSGLGAGHGEGLDLEAAQASGQSAQAELRAAYPELRKP